ncbi:5116_t:CDS:2, partial [Gigaspora margarita]
WNIIDFLNECDVEPFDIKIDRYTKSLKDIANNRQGEKERVEKAQLLLDRFKLYDRIKAKEWEKKRSQKQVHIHQPINGNLNGTIINGGTIGSVNSEVMSKKRDQNEEDHEEKTTKRKKIDDYFSPVCENQHDQAQQPCENVKNNEEPPVVGPPDESDGYTTPSSYSPILKSSTAELSNLDFVNNPFLEEDREKELAKTNGLFVESNVHEILSLSSILLLTPNSHSNIMINIFGSPLLDQIHQEFMPAQQIVLDPKCESTFRKVIKMAMKNSCEDAINWLYGQLANENIFRENAVSAIHQLQTKAVLFVGEDCLDSAIDKGADVKVLGFQCIDYKVDFYVMDLIKGSYIMIHIGQFILPASIKEMLPFVDEMEMLLRVREIFRESFNILYTNLCHPSPPLAKASFKRDTL